MAHQEAKSVSINMEKQSLDQLSSQNLIPINSPKVLAWSYILTCQCEGKSPKTTATYEEHLRCLLSYYLQHDFPDEPHKLTTYHLGNFLWYVANEPIHWCGSSTTTRRPAGQSTVNHYYRVLNTFFKWLKQEGLAADNPLAYIRPSKIEQKEVHALQPKEAQALIAQCSPKSVLVYRNRVIIMMFLDSGIRVSELAKLKLNDVDMDTDAVFIEHGKGGKQRVVRIGSATRKAL